MVLETVRSKVKSQHLLGAFFMHHLEWRASEGEGASRSCQAHSLKPFHILTLIHTFGWSPGGLNTSLEDPSPSTAKG